MSTAPPDRAQDPRLAGLKLVAALVAVMWAVEVADVLDDHRLELHGIRPRDVDGLQGVVFAPFLHAGWDHLIGNTVPFVLFGGLIALAGAARVAMVTVIVAFVSGMGTWLVAPENSLHVGASGVVFGYGTYLISRGIFERSLRHLLVGVLVGATYGSVLLGGLEPQNGISWQGHLFGAIGGVVAAYLLATRPQERGGVEGSARLA